MFLFKILLSWEKSLSRTCSGGQGGRGKKIEEVQVVSSKNIKENKDRTNCKSKVFNLLLFPLKQKFSWLRKMFLKN
jgi:hypothetical protein